MGTEPLTYEEFSREFYDDTYTDEFSDRDFANLEELICNSYRKYLAELDEGFIDD